MIEKTEKRLERGLFFDEHIENSGEQKIIIVI